MCLRSDGTCVLSVDSTGFLNVGDSGGPANGTIKTGQISLATASLTTANINISDGINSAEITPTIVKAKNIRVQDSVGDGSTHASLQADGPAIFGGVLNVYDGTGSTTIDVNGVQSNGSVSCNGVVSSADMTCIDCVSTTYIQPTGVATPALVLDGLNFPGLPSSPGQYLAE